MAGQLNQNSSTFFRLFKITMKNGKCLTKIRKDVQTFPGNLLHLFFMYFKFTQPICFFNAKQDRFPTNMSNICHIIHRNLVFVFKKNKTFE